MQLLTFRHLADAVMLCYATYKWESHTRSNLKLVTCPRTLQRVLWRSWGSNHRPFVEKVHSSLSFSSCFLMKIKDHPGQSVSVYFNLVLHYQCVSTLITQCSQEQSKTSLIPSTQKIIFLLILKEWLNGDKKLLYCAIFHRIMSAQIFTDFH